MTLRTRDLFNPVNILGVGFFLNMLLASRPISPLQRETWAEETKVIFAQAVVLWFLFPAVTLLFFPVRRTGRLRTLFKYHSGIQNPFIGRLAAVLVIAAFFLESWVQAGTILPVLRPGVDIHSEYTTGLGLFTAPLSSAVGVVLFIYFLKKKNPLDLLLLILVLLMPLTQLARLGFVVLALTLATCGYYLSFPRNWKYALSVLLISFSMFSTLIVVSTYRSRNVGASDINYSRDIGWGPSDVVSQSAAYYVRYFVFSFDSFDGLVRRNPSGTERTLGAFTLRPLSSGIFRLHNILPAYPLHDYLAERSDPVLSAYVIATALSYFYLDFGSEWIAIPLLLYMGIVLLVYYKKSSHFYWVVTYAFLASALALTSFTDLLSNVKTFYSIVSCLLLLWLSFRPGNGWILSRQSR